MECKTRGAALCSWPRPSIEEGRDAVERGADKIDKKVRLWYIALILHIFSVFLIFLSILPGL
jgi:hypothetical protein